MLGRQVANRLNDKRIIAANVIDEILKSYHCKPVEYPEGICFYQPLPQTKLTISDLLAYMKGCISFSDFLLIAGATLAVTVVGMLMPQFSRTLTGPVLSSGSSDALVAIGIFIVCTLVSKQLIDSVKEVFQTRVTSKISLGVEASMMMRLLSLPASFFGKYSPGELNARSDSVKMLCTTILNTVLGTGLGALMSLLYIGQIFAFAEPLVEAAVYVILITVGVSIATTLIQARVNRRQMDLAAKESGMSYGLITGIQKIRLAGASAS